jgi:hypothetical protein
MTTNFQEVFHFLGDANKVLSGLLVFAAFLLYRSNKSYFLIFIYCLAMAMVEASSTYYSIVYKNNLIFFHVNAMAEFSILTFYFYRIYLSLGSKVESLKKIGVIGFLILCISFLVDSIEFSMTFASFTILLYCYYYYYLRLSKEYYEKLDLDLIFVTSMLIMHSISMIVILFRSQLFTIQIQYYYVIEITRILALLFTNLSLLFTGTKKLILNYFSENKILDGR